MTIRQKMEQRLFNSGMSEDQAKAVMDMVVADPTMSSTMEQRWDDEAEGYPAPLFAALWMEVESKAVEWIDLNCPKARFRSVFADKGT